MHDLGLQLEQIVGVKIIVAGLEQIVSGEAAWSPKERWAISGRASNINPGRIRSDLPGSLNFTFAAEGLGFGERGDLSVDVRNMYGRLRGSPASGGGRIANKGTAWQLDRVRLSLGGTTLSAGLARTSTDPVLHNSLRADQKLYGPLHVGTALNDVGETTENKSVTASFKLNW